jgi:hypothetical protein
MQLTQADDLDDLYDIFVTGIAAIEEIAPGIVRVSYFKERRLLDWDEDDARGLKRKVVDHHIWSLPQLADNLLTMQKALKEMRATRGQPKLVQAAGMH